MINEAKQVIEESKDCKIPPKNFVYAAFPPEKNTKEKYLYYNLVQLSPVFTNF